MEHIIIGTAGHIDHGKTALIKALTGRDTDTLKEEKARGITIDLGFTYFDLPGNEADGGMKQMRAGIVDVPGHEKFLPNMLAGVCGMDLVLLVVALDEGVKPQTLEHMEILSQIGVKDGIVVLTKADCVDAEWADLMEVEIAAELEGTIFASWPRVRVSAIRGDGIGELKAKIGKLAGQIKKSRNTDGTFRMPVDRVLSVQGRGTVITGTVLEGYLRAGEQIQLYPGGGGIRVRGIQIHGRDVEEVCAGQRAALLLAGRKKEDVRRGAVAAAPDSLTPAKRLNVRIQMAGRTERILKNRARVHLHIGTSHLVCRVVLSGCEALRRGESADARLLIEGEVAVKEGDRFVIRFYSPMETIGGGIVLDACADRHKRREHAVSQENLAEWEKSILKWLEAYHRKYPYRQGAPKNLLKDDCFRAWEQEQFDVVLRHFLEEKKICRRGTQIWKADFQIQRDARFLNCAKCLKKGLTEAGFRFLDYRELCPKNMDLAVYEDILSILEEENLIVRISETYYITAELAEEAVDKVEAYFREHEILTYSTLRDLLDTTRRCAKLMVAYLDVKKVTKQCEKETERKAGKKDDPNCIGGR